MFTRETKKLIDHLVMYHGVATVYAVINSVTGVSKDSDKYNGALVAAMNAAFRQNSI